MFEILFVAAFVWLLIKSVGLMLRLTWGMAKLAAGVLLGLAVPLLVVCLVFAGGIVLFAPLVVVGIAYGILKACT